MARTSWNDESSRKLLVIINEEKSKGVSKYSWPIIAKIYNAQTGSSLGGKQVSNHYNDLKDKYKTWEELQKLNGISYNPVSGEVDVDESNLERYEKFLQRHPKYGAKIIKYGLANIDELSKLLDGKLAHGVGGSFSPAMARSVSYLTKGVEKLDITSGSEVNADEQHVNEEYANLLGSDSSPEAVAQKITQINSRKRKGLAIIDSAEIKRRQDSFDTVIQLLSGIGTSSGSSKSQLVSVELARLKIAEEKGDEYFVKAMKYLSDEKHADSFLALQNDNQKLIYLREIKIDSLFYD